MEILFRILDVVFLFALGYYLATNLQWYNYSLWRVVTKHHKQRWHFLYFILPLIIYCLCDYLQWSKVFYILLCVVYLPALIFWSIKLDAPLKWTGRVYRFFGIYFVFIVLNFLLEFFYGSEPYAYLLILAFTLVVSRYFEILLFAQYQKMAGEKIASLHQLKVVLITASYGKTSIKNYLAQILEARYNVHSTPRSVNTIKGIVSDVNLNINEKNEFYIAEAGARQKGDIAQIAHLLNPQYVIIGKIGEQHLEYFKTFENIVATKYEAIQSKRLYYALSEMSNPIPNHLQDKIQKAPQQAIRNVISTLEGTSFELQIDGNWHQFETPVLGAFNAYNLALCVLMARKIGLSMEEISSQVSKIKGVEHRLHKSIVNNRLILDDSFNGNLEGMKEAIRISSGHQGRKVIITPGVVESSEEANIELASEISKVFDVVIITGELNAKVLSEHIVGCKKIILKDKSAMENTLKATLRDGDLILFANDAPNYI